MRSFSCVAPGRHSVRLGTDRRCALGYRVMPLRGVGQCQGERNCVSQLRRGSCVHCPDTDRSPEGAQQDSPGEAAASLTSAGAALGDGSHLKHGSPEGAKQIVCASVCVAPSGLGAFFFVRCPRASLGPSGDGLRCALGYRVMPLRGVGGGRANGAGGSFPTAIHGLQWASDPGSLRVTDCAVFRSMFRIFCSLSVFAIGLLTVDLVIGLTGPDYNGSRKPIARY